jgi:hypothetical protein
MGLIGFEPVVVEDPQVEVVLGIAEIASNRDRLLLLHRAVFD